MGMRNRLIEVGLACLVSMIASSFVSAWTLSARLANFESAIKTNADNLAIYSVNQQTNRTAIAAADSVNAQQNASIAVGDARWLEVQRRLGNIETQLVELTRRRN